MADGLDHLFAQAISLHQSGDLAGAIGRYRMLSGLCPTSAPLQVNLGIALQASGKLAEAAECFAHAARLDPLLPEAPNSLGCVLIAMGKPLEAFEALETARALAPHQPQPYNNMGNAFRLLERYLDAALAYERAADLDPGSSQPLSNLGCMLLELGEYGRAEQAALKALAIDPNQAEAWNCLGNVMALTNRPVEAEEAFRQAPHSAQAAVNLSSLLYDLERFEEAAEQARAVIDQIPNYVPAFNNLGNALLALNKVSESEKVFRQGMALAPDDPRVRFNLSSALLKQGKFDEGWAAYEARRDLPWSPLRVLDFGVPFWDGGPLSGGLLLHGEQGYGDCLQFCRYAPLLARQIDHPLTLRVEPALVRLLRDSFAPLVNVISVDEPLPEGLAAHAPLMSLPYLLKGLMPGNTPYLTANDSTLWMDRLTALPGLKVGLAWAGAPRPYSKIANLLDKRRSISASLLSPLADVAEISWVSLQKGEAAKDPVPNLPLIDWTEDLNDFADTAALMAGLDVVVTVDTSIAHLAGALNKPVWIMSRFDGCWRWLQGRDDSPWYPSARLFHQDSQGDWSGVIARVADGLTDLAKKNGG